MQRAIAARTSGAEAQPRHPTADRIIVSAEFAFSPDPSFRAAALATVDAAAPFGAKAVRSVQRAFADRGIL